MRVVGMVEAPSKPTVEAQKPIMPVPQSQPTVETEKPVEEQKSTAVVKRKRAVKG